MAASDVIELQVPRMRYDITMPFVEGRVEIEGVQIKAGRGVGGTVLTDDSPLKTGDFGLVDLNMGNWMPAVEAGWEMIGLPVFSKRKPASTYLFVRTDRGIDTPKDLEGKRVGAGRYRSALTIWARGFLQHRYGVDITRLRWVVWGGETFPLHDTGTSVERAPDPKKSVFDALLDGEIDAIMTDISDGAMFDRLEASPQVRRLFPDYIAEDRRIYQETGIYTPVHLIAMSKKLDRAHPELAGKLYTAFERSKQMAYEEILDDRGGFSVVYLRERLKEQMAEWGDPFKHGITANQSTLEAFMQYNVEQGMVSRPYSYEELFASSTLDT